MEKPTGEIRSAFLFVNYQIDFDNESFLSLLVLVSLAKNVTGQHYIATNVNVYPHQEEAVPESVVKMFRQVTFSIRDLINYENDLAMRDTVVHDTVVDVRYVYWFTNVDYGKKFYSVQFVYNTYEKRKNSSSLEGSVEFEADTLSEKFVVSEIRMPVKADTLPAKIRRVIDGRVKRHCRKYDKEIGETYAAYTFYEGKIYSVVCSLSLVFKGKQPDYFGRTRTDFDVRGFIIRSDGSVHKSFPTPYGMRD